MIGQRGRLEQTRTSPNGRVACSRIVPHGQTSPCG
jgi:hypothetical protein